MTMLDLAERGRARRDQIIAFVVGFKATNGYPPTVRQIMEGIGLKSTESTHRQLVLLVKQGRIVRRQVSARRVIFDLPDGVT